MKKVVLSAVALAFSAMPVVAADLPAKAVKAPPPVVAVAPAWDIAFGGAIMTDYISRGITQSDHGPAVNAYFEPRFNISPTWQLYLGIAGTSTRLPQTPSAEIDLYGGVRPTFGPLALDLGAIYYWYPHGSLILYPNGNISLAEQSYWEIYLKPTWTVNDMITLGANGYFFNSWLNTGASGSYLSATAKVTLPGMPTDWGWYVSGEVGRLALGTPKFNLAVYPTPADFPDYTTWNVGLGLTYKVFTFDLRYYGTDLTKSNCNILTGDPGATLGGVVSPMNGAGLQSKWCGNAVVGKLSFDLTASGLK